MEIKNILNYVIKLRQECVKEEWYPDDDSKHAGYLAALDDIIEYIVK